MEMENLTMASTLGNLGDPPRVSPGCNQQLSHDSKDKDKIAEGNSRAQLSSAHPNPFEAVEPGLMVVHEPIGSMDREAIPSA